MDKLTADGVNPGRVERAFSDPRVEPFDGLTFSPQRPREPASRYRHFLRGPSINSARGCRDRHARIFEATERETRVPANVLAALLFVETACGRNTGSYVVLHRLARLAMANEPENLRRNILRFADSNGQVDSDTELKLRMRARYLEDTFYPEVRATFTVADRLGVDPLDLRGSPSGAFGYPQFLPTSFLRYAVDGDGDGIIDLYNPADAVASAARYLQAHGWEPGISHQERRQVIWHYNRSDAYVDTILALATRIDQAPSVAASKPKAPQRQAAKPKTSQRQTAKPK